MVDELAQCLERIYRNIGNQSGFAGIFFGQKYFPEARFMRFANHCEYAADFSDIPLERKFTNENFSFGIKLHFPARGKITHCHAEIKYRSLFFQIRGCQTYDYLLIFLLW